MILHLDGNRLSRTLVPLIMTTFQAIIDTVLRYGIRRPVRSNHVDSAKFDLKKMGVR